MRKLNYKIYEIYVCTKEREKPKDNSLKLETRHPNNTTVKYSMCVSLDQKKTLITPQIFLDKKFPEGCGCTCLIHQCLACGLEYDKYSINSSGFNEQSTKEVFLDQTINHSQLPAFIPTQQWELWNETRESIASKLYIALILQWISHSEEAVGRKPPSKVQQSPEPKHWSQGRQVKSKWRRRVLPLNALFYPFWNLPSKFY